MSLKYVFKSVLHHKLRTAIIALALAVGVALVGALLALVDTQRQFTIQAAGNKTGGYDLSIAKSDLAATPFFTITRVEALSRAAYGRIVSMYPRIQASVEARKVGVLNGQAVTFVAINPQSDHLVSLARSSGSNIQGGISILGVRIGGTIRPIDSGQGGGGGSGGGNTGGGNTDGGGGGGGGGDAPATTASAPSAPGDVKSAGVYPPAPGQVFLDSATAGLLGARVGDKILLSYAIPTQRAAGQAAITNTSTLRVSAQFVVSGIGVLNGLSNVSNPLVLSLGDAQRWLSAAGQANQLLLVWQSSASGINNARATVTQARAVGERVRNQLGAGYVVSLPKYTSLEKSAQRYSYTQTYITLYGLLSMGIIGLMVNALMMTTVAEQKYDLAVLRVLGSPRARMFGIVIIEVVILGIIGIVFGLLLGRVINDRIMVPILLTNLNLPAGVQANWTLQAVLIPTAITIVVLALATISPARAAAATKVMVVLNPAAADQPTLEDLTKLRERRADTGLLVTGLVLLAFSAMILIVLPTVFLAGYATWQTILTFGSLLLMVIGISLLFYFFTTPLERVLVAVYRIISPGAAFLAGRYALRGKGRNAMISLMVVMSGVLPCLLATQLALQDANLKTGTRFNNGAPLIVQSRFAGGEFPIFSSGARQSIYLTNADIAAVKGQPGIGAVVGIADNLIDLRVSDPVQLRKARASLVGVKDDLNQVLYTYLYRWIEGDASVLMRVVTDTNIAIISQGLSGAMGLHVGDKLLVKGAGIDHTRLLTIAGVAARIPGFKRYFSRVRSEGHSSGIIVNLETYRDLQNNPANGSPDPAAPLFTKLMATVQPGVNRSTMLSDLRNYLSKQNSLTVTATSEQVAQARIALEQSRVFVVLLTGLSMVTAIFGVLAVMYTAVMGRRIEIGMLKAIGASKAALRGTFIGEAVVTTLAAGLAGIIAGTILGYAINITQYLQNDEPFVFAFDLNTAGIIVALVSIAAIFSAALATQPVIRQKAVKILRGRG